MKEKDIPAVFRWETPWRPTEIEELQTNLGLRPGRTRDINTVMGYVLGQALKLYRADPNRWISYSRNQDWCRDPGVFSGSHRVRKYAERRRSTGRGRRGRT